MFVTGTLLCSLSDRFGRARVYIPGGLLAAVTSCLSFIMLRGPAPAWLALVFAAGIGLGFGITVALVPAMIADVFHGRHFGSIMGTANMGFTAGGTISPWLAGYLYDINGSYFVPMIVMAVATLLSVAAVGLVSRLKLLKP